jgi:hypothetical protein
MANLTYHCGICVLAWERERERERRKELKRKVPFSCCNNKSDIFLSSLIGQELSVGAVHSYRYRYRKQHRHFVRRSWNLEPILRHMNLQLLRRRRCGRLVRFSK